MDFCPMCNSILFPGNGKLKCNCGYEAKLTNKDDYKVDYETNPYKELIVTDKGSNLALSEIISCSQVGGGYR